MLFQYLYSEHVTIVSRDGRMANLITKKRVQKHRAWLHRSDGMGPVQTKEGRVRDPICLCIHVAYAPQVTLFGLPPLRKNKERKVVKK